MITEEQRKARSTGIFSSDVPRIMAGGGVEVWLEKIGERERPDISEMEFVMLGNMLEAAALDAYQREWPGLKIERNLPTKRHAEHDWLGAHLDALCVTNERFVIEAKAVGVYNRRMWGEPGTDEVPDHVLWQVQEQMAVEDVESAAVPVVFATEQNLTQYITKGTVDVDTYIVQRSELLIDTLIERSREVWRGVETMTPPKPRKIGDARLLYAKDSGAVVEATDAIADLVRALRNAKDDASAMEKRIESLSERVQRFMGEASELRWQGQTLVTWKKEKDREGYFVEPRPGSRKMLVKKVTS